MIKFVYSDEVKGWIMGLILFKAPAELRFIDTFDFGSFTLWTVLKSLEKSNFMLNGKLWFLVVHASSST